MIYWKEECKKLAETHAKIVVVDRYETSGIPVFASRSVIGAVGSRNGRNSYWSVLLDGKLSDDCACVAYSHILAVNDGEKLEHFRLTQYHPAWMLSDEGEQELVNRKYQAMLAIGHCALDASCVTFFRVSKEEGERLKNEYLNSI